ncbi:recyclin-1, partial [Phenoliferia sp. Uapishka_3]
MDRWTAIAPDRRAQQGPRIKLIGRLPAEAYLAILAFLPIPDIPAFALSSKKLADLTRDDRVWRIKLAALDYRGPGAVSWKEGVASSAPPGTGTGAQATSLGTSKAAVRPPPSRPPAPLYATPPDDDEFGDFFDGEGDVALVHDDGFGEFQDFDAGDDFEDVMPIKAEDPDPFGLGDFTDLSLTGKPQERRRSKGGDDLMMLFDDEYDDLPPAPTRPPLDSQLTFQASRPAPPRTKTATLPAATSTVTSPADGRTYREIFIHHHSLLLPYYLSFLTHTTSSLIFTSPSLTPETRAHLLASLVRFCSPLVAPTRSLPQRQTVLRNVQSGMDFFESALLAEFERADTRGEEGAMREKARILWDLNGSQSVVQVFVQKREIFYDQTHNPLKNLVKVETPNGDKADGIDFSPMNTYINDVLRVISREGGLIARVFPLEADVLIYFTERIANDVISDYITTLLSDAQPLQHPLFLLATAATFGQVYRLVDAVLAIEPKNPLVTKERAEDVIFRMFEPHMDDYLQEEGDWIREVLEGMCVEWDDKELAHIRLARSLLTNDLQPALVKRNVLAGFTKVLLLPVTIIPKTATMGLNAITSGATGAFNTFASLGTQFGGTSGPTSRARTPNPGSPIEKPVPITVDPDAPSWGVDVNQRASIDLAGNVHLPSDATSTFTASSTSLSLNSSSNPTPKAPNGRFDRMQLLLSLDTALQLIQADRDCLKRVQTFVRYPGTYGRKVRDAIEEVFIILLQTLSEKHVCPGFAKATQQMALYKPEDHEAGTSVAPLVQFFELVHIGDTIQQMVEVYFDKEMAAYIDKKDFLNAVVREKKRFEMALDDAVAQGLNAGVNILMNQVEHIIFTHQGLRDFSPPDDADLDLQATAACQEAIDVLTTHCNMLKGSTDKQILEVFHQEVGIRLHGILLKHLKRLIVSIEGGFQLIADLNAYHAFITTLRQPQVTLYFTSLKMVGEIFIIDSPKDLGHLVRDVTRYDGTLSTEDLYEIVQRRADWKRIETEVERGLFGFKKEDCTVM